MPLTISHQDQNQQVFLILAAILPLMLYTAFIILAVYNYLKDVYIDVSFIVISIIIISCLHFFTLQALTPPQKKTKFSQVSVFAIF